MQWYMPLPTCRQEPICSEVSFRRFRGQVVRHVVICRYLFSGWFLSAASNRLGNEIAVQKPRVGSSGACECAHIAGSSLVMALFLTCWKDGVDLPTECTSALPRLVLCVQSCFYRRQGCVLGLKFCSFLNGKEFESWGVMAWWCLPCPVCFLSCFIVVDNCFL